MTEPRSPQDLNVLVDRLILEQGRLDPLELLLACDWLTYADYESWRLGRVPDLEGVLRVPAAAAAEVLTQAGLYAAAQRLAAEPLEQRGWGATDRIISIGPPGAAHPGLVRACASAYVPPANRMQLDLFHDSQDQILEEAVRSALTGRRIDAAHRALTRLMALDPRHPRLRRYLHLMQAVEDLPSLTPGGQLDALESMAPAAQDLLGHRARDLLAPLWATLAEALAGRPFDPAAPRCHAGYAWARAGRYPAARAAIEAQPAWRGRPALVLAHLEACRRIPDPVAARLDWVLLCWGHPLEAAQALGAKDLADAWLRRLWVQFNDADLDLETADFPAWLLLADPATAAAVPPDLAPPGPAGEPYRLLHQMRNGADGIAQRKALAAACPALLRCHLAALEGARAG